MAEIWETQDTGEGEEGVERRTRSLRYQVAIDPSTEDDADAYAIVAATRPSVYPGTSFAFSSTRLKPIEAGVYEAECEYTTKQTEREKEEFEGTVEIGGSVASQRVWWSLLTVASFGPEGGVAPDFEGAVNVSENGIDGIDIPVPAQTITVSWAFPTAWITTARIARWDSYATKTNSAPWSFTINGRTYSYDTREVLFQHYTLTEKLARPTIETKFSFAVQRSKTNLVVGKGVLGGVQLPNGKWAIPMKQGWDYLWVRGRSRVSADSVVETPAGAYLERLFETVDFNDIWS